MCEMSSKTVTPPLSGGRGYPPLLGAEVINLLWAETTQPLTEGRGNDSSVYSLGYPSVSRLRFSTCVWRPKLPTFVWRWKLSTRFLEGEIILPLS
jgi:hypothetical protein